MFPIHFFLLVFDGNQEYERKCCCQEVHEFNTFASPLVLLRVGNNAIQFG